MKGVVMGAGGAVPGRDKREGTMKIRSLALLGAAALALTSPALADEPGGCLGIGAGYDPLNQIHFRNTANLTNGWVPQHEGALVLGSFGYTWHAVLRTELQPGYDWQHPSHT